MHLTQVNQHRRPTVPDRRQQTGMRGARSRPKNSCLRIAIFSQIERRYPESNSPASRPAASSPWASPNPARRPTTTALQSRCSREIGRTHRKTSGPARTGRKKTKQIIGQAESAHRPRREQERCSFFLSGVTLPSLAIRHRPLRDRSRL